MPRSFRYLGPPCSLGRFGNVATGDTVDLLLEEEASVQDSADFEPLLDLAAMPLVPLQGTESFDLREVRWNAPQLGEHLRTYYVPSQLLTLARAMTQIGCEFIIVEGTPPLHIVDTVQREAERNGWHLMELDERRACPVMPEAETSQEPDKTEEPEEPEETPQEPVTATSAKSEEESPTPDANPETTTEQPAEAEEQLSPSTGEPATEAPAIPVPAPTPVPTAGSNADKVRDHKRGRKK